jgi:hypothetical protein
MFVLYLQEGNKKTASDATDVRPEAVSRVMECRVLTLGMRK